MKRIILIGVSLSIITSMAMADFTSGVQKYFGGGISLEDIEDANDDGIAGELSIGGVFSNNFGVEAKFTKTLSKAEEKNGRLIVEIDVTTVSIYGTYSHNLSPEFIVMPKIGFTNFLTDLDTNDGRSEDDGSLDLSYGIDLKYSFSPSTRMYLGYTFYNPEFEGDDFDAKHLSIGIQQLF